MRITLTSKNLVLNSIDKKSAFLQGKPQERDIFIVPLSEAGIDKLWKLEKCIWLNCCSYKMVSWRNMNS